ncbi:MAG: ExeM/NucH family extracellular endonuclease [Geodermatophilaceae bacterium]|nr:ExeM/NucH family extracellular endonuclease [Geodermatophilaceae bacterium]
MRNRSRATLSIATIAAVTASGLALAGPAVADHTTSGVFISEFHYDNVSTDSGEAIEVQAPEGTDLTGWSLVLYNGSGGAVYDTDLLSGVVDDSQVVVVEYPSNGIQNGSPDGIALVDDSGAVQEFLSYEGTMTAVGGPADGQLSVDVGVEETGDTPVGHSLQRDPDDHAVWFDPMPNSFGAVNGGPGPDPDPVTCDAVVTHTISEVQGDGEFTPLSGQTVTVSGVVVADLQEGGFDGFHLQDPVGDGNPATSDGIFIYAPSGPEVALGDSVVVTGTPGEFFDLTQISATGAAVCPELGFQVPAPAPLDLPLEDAEFETLEGMYVVPVDTLTVTEVFNLNRFGEVVLSEGGRLFAPTEVAEPGPASIAVAEENQTRRVVLDDGRDFNLATAGVDPPFLTVEDPVRVGDTATSIEDVVLSFGFDAWRLQPVDGLGDESTFAPTNPRPETPEDVGGNSQVAAFNVLNYFTTLTSENSEARGADTPEEFRRQEAKIVEAISLLGADVVALQEIENSVALGEPIDEALAALVAALNADAGSTVWAFVPSPANLPPPDQQDVITNAIIYQVDSVVRVGESVARTNEAVWFNAREPIAQTFEPIGDGGGDAFTVVSNHFKSKGGEGEGDNENTGPGGQGAFNGDRTRQAEDLVLFVEELVASTGDPDVLLVGDFNAYTMEDPIDVFREAGLVDLASMFAPDDYSYVFNGETGSLDHVIVTMSVAVKVTGVDIWNINAVESFGYQYDGTPSLYAPDQYRASDHDPILVGLDLDEDRAPGDRLRELIRRLIEFLRDRRG